MCFALWTTVHPTQSSREEFVARCEQLREMGVRHSVGVVGFKEAWDDIVALRAALADETYLWVNAYKREAGYYSADDIARFETVDPLFGVNTRYHPSLGEACRGGASSFTVDGQGDVRRCHFIAEPIGNLYDGSFEDGLRERTCVR